MLTGKVRKDNPVGSFNKVLQLCSELGTIDIDKYQGGNYMKQLLQSSYFINEEGLVFNKQMKEVKRDSSNGGIIVNINLEGKRKKYPIWKLMAKTYFDMQEDEIFNIKDGDTTNTNLSNYEVLKLDKIGKRIKGFEDYIVTKEGEIFSTKYGRLQKVATYYDSNGYEMVKLCKENKTYAKLVHRLVAEAYIPNPENKEEVDHRDSNVKNNYYSNLRWATRKENMSYCFEGKSPVRNFVKCKLLNENDKEFLMEFNSKKECCGYAKTLGCSYSSLMKYGRNNGYYIEKP